MNATDALWQRVLDEECARWSARPSHELKALPQITQHKARSGTDELKYALWHENPAEWSNMECHSFVLQAHRPLWFFATRNYLAGFSLDKNDSIIPIDDDYMIARYD